MVNDDDITNAGKDNISTKCLKEYDQVASFCKSGYCLKKFGCIPLNYRYPG